MIAIYLNELFLAWGGWEKWVIVGLFVEADRMGALASGWGR